MIYLASTSPRRKKMLRERNIRFRLIRPDYEESVNYSTPAATVRAHALGKALSAAKLVADGTILSADTIVWFGGKIIGKPSGMTHARAILGKLQGRPHTVFTGVAVLERRGGRTVARKVLVEKTVVYLKPLSEREIRAYFRRINPLDKAGAYAIQSTHSIVEKVRGLYSNAVGLPIERIARFLK